MIHGTQHEIINHKRVLIEAKDLALSFDNNHLFKGFNTLITEGEKIGIIGKNGCGKTSLVRTLIGLQEPSHGSIKHFKAINFGYLDQQCSILSPKEKIIDQIPSHEIGIGSKSINIKQYLRDFGFSDHRQHEYITNLSGGERKRLALAVILATKKEILILDEPTNDLDFDTIENLENYILEYQGACLIITHDRSFLDQTTTSIIGFEDNKEIKEIMGGFSQWWENKEIQVEKKETKTKTKNQHQLIKKSFNKLID